MQRRRLILCLLVLLPVVVYGRVVGFEFVNYDDGEYVEHNVRVANGLTGQNVVWAFTNVEMVNWHPLTWLSYLLDAQLFGMKPGAFHATNLLFHVINTLLLFAVLRRMTNAEAQSAFVAALFAIHPLHVESVAWVSERKDVLSSFFGLLAIGAYANYAIQTKWKWYFASLALFICSLMAKPTLVTLPFLLLLLDWWPLGRTENQSQTREQNALNRAREEDVSDFENRSPRGRTRHGLSNIAREAKTTWKQLLAEKAPFLAVAIAFCVIAVVAQGDAVKSTEEQPLWPRVANAVVVYVLYVRQMVWPNGLAVMYPHPGGSIPTGEVVGAALLLLTATLAVLVVRKRKPYLLIGWLWYLGTLVPMIGIVQVGGQRMADRYTYFPLLGLYIAITWFFADLVSARRWRPKAIACLSGAVVLAFASVAWMQVGFWRDSITLFRRSCAVTKNNAIAHINLGHAFQMQDELDDAFFHYQTALKIDGRYSHTHFNLAILLERRDRYEEAVGHYRETIRLDPKHAKAHNNLGNVFSSLERLDEAEAEFRQAIALDPQFAKPYFNLGTVFRKRGHRAEAVRYFEESLSLAPDWPEARKQLSIVHKEMAAAFLSDGKPDKAIGHLNRTLQLQPNSTSGNFLMGQALGRLGRIDEAVTHLTRAVKRRPNIAEAHYELGALLLKQGKREAGIAELRTAVRLNPNLSQASELLKRVQQER